ncbi:MAG: glycoside hydrolase family 25 protein [Lachnospiraceae bacterium]
MKKLFLAMLACLTVLLTAGIVTTDAQAAEASEDPLYGRAHGQIDEGFFDENASNGISLFSNDVLQERAGTTVRKGIDVSKWQGDIDWTAVKNSGVEFVIVRVGNRTTGTGALEEDPNYQKNIEGALNAGLKVGAYIFSQAINEQEAVEEANFLLERVYKYDITLPLVIDFEYAAGNTGRLYDANLSREQATAVVNAFCARVTQYGYTGMVYANRSTLTNDLNASDIEDKYRVWLANYQSPQMTDFGNPTTIYQGKYDFFQFSSKGSVPGINGDVDLDYWYDDGTISGKDYGAVFDITYYADHNQDLKDAYGYDGTALLQHFINVGMSEGRQGNAGFNVFSYKNLYPDLRQTYGNDLKSYYLHYINNGRFEGRVTTGYENTLVGAIATYNGVNYSRVYDYNYYVSHNADIKDAYGFDDEAVLAHFVSFGMQEGRQGKENFNVISYRNQYADLRRAYGNNLSSYYIHYLNYGYQEGRTGTGYENMLAGAVTTYNGVNYSAVYDYNYYVAKNPDIKKKYGADDAAVLAHFVKFGMSEGRQSKESFNVHSYKNRYADLRSAYGNDLKAYYLHYVNYGCKEGRTGTGYENTLVGTVTTYNGVNYAEVYNYDYYTSANPDVKRAYGTDDTAVLAHFVNYGMKEGRQASENFNVWNYRGRYADLEAAFGNDLIQYYLHYLNNGIREGRDGR